MSRSNKNLKPRTTERECPPAIHGDVVYPIELVRAYWFRSDAEWLAARRKGLRHLIYYVGRRGYIDGSDLQKGLKEQGARRP